MKAMTVLNELTLLLRTMRSAARVSTAFEVGGQPLRKDLERLGIAPEAFARLQLRR